MIKVLCRFSPDSEDQFHNASYGQVNYPTGTGVWFTMETTEQDEGANALSNAMKNLEKSRSGWIPKYFKEANSSSQTSEKVIDD